MSGPQQKVWSLERTGRQRIRQACQPCKTRKRRCNGQQPCTACIRHEYTCSYDAESPNVSHIHRVRRHRPPTGSGFEDRHRSQADALPPVAQTGTSPGDEVGNPAHDSTAAKVLELEAEKNVDIRAKYMEANSGVVFAHLLGLQWGSLEAPQARAFGWNLDLRPRATSSERNIVRCMSHPVWWQMFDVYKRTVHPLYSFLDLESVEILAERRWREANSTNAYDHVLCGIAALGSLFNSPHQSNDPEIPLVECAREILEASTTSSQPTVQDCEAWLLRTLYLRCSSAPHAAWMASNTTMHMVEAVRLHQQSGTSLLFPTSNLVEVSVERQRLLYWLARLLNTWISNEYGRSGVHLKYASCPKPTPKPGDPTSDLLSLFSLSECLDPNIKVGDSAFEDSLGQLLRFSTDSAPVILSQSNLAFAFYRRIRAKGSTDTAKVTDQVLRIGQKGLHASKQLIEEELPWWHIANVPYQFSCITLAIDTGDSLAYALEAVTVLRQVTECFGTRMPKRALDTVQFLVQLCQNRKTRDASLLEHCFTAMQPSLTMDTPSQSSSAVSIREISDDLLYLWDAEMDPGNLVFPNSFMQTMDLSAFGWNSSDV